MCIYRQPTQEGGRTKGESARQLELSADSVVQRTLPRVYKWARVMEKSLPVQQPDATKYWVFMLPQCQLLGTFAKHDFLSLLSVIHRSSYWKVLDVGPIPTLIQTVGDKTFIRRVRNRQHGTESEENQAHTKRVGAVLTGFGGRG